MQQNRYFIEKTSGTSADALLTVGFASLLGDLYERQHGTTEGIVIRDAGPAYTISLPQPLDTDQLPVEPIFLLLPLESGKRSEKQKEKGRGPLDGFDYDGELAKSKSYAAQIKNLGPALQTPEARLRHDPALERIDDYAPDSRLGHYIAISRMKIPDTFNELVLRWRELSPLQQHAHVRLLLHLFAQTINDVEGAVVAWQELARREKLTGEAKANALQIINPSSGKGAHFARAGKLSIKGQDRFWLLELLKFRGFMDVAAPLSVKEPNSQGQKAKRSEDRKTYVLLPRVIELDALRAMMRDFRAVFWSTTFIKLDILASLRFAQVVVEQYKRQFQEKEGKARLKITLKKRVTSLASGFEATFYKDLGNAYATMHIANLGLPIWLPELNTQQAVESAEAILTEHIQLIQNLLNHKREEGAEEYELLRLYRDFLSGHDLTPFWQFTTAYSSYYMSAREKNRYVVQLSTSGLEQLIMNTQQQEREPLTSVIEDEGFQNIASAIREATVRAQYRRTQQKDRRYEVRYGLGQDLMRQARHRDSFVQALSSFLLDYNAETAREEEKVATELKRQLQASDRKERRLRYMVSTTDVRSVISLIDRYGVELIGSLLVTYGYSFDSDRVSTAKEEPSQTSDMN